MIDITDLFWVLPDVIVRAEFECEVSLVISRDVHHHRDYRPLGLNVNHLSGNNYDSYFSDFLSVWSVRPGKKH